MKIGFLHADNDFLNDMFSQFKKQMPGHDVVAWKAGEDAPATDLEMLIGMGEITRAMLEPQKKLTFLQTASAGYEGVDLHAASELGIWVSFAESDETGNAVSVAEFAVMLLLAASRKLPVALHATRDHGVTKPQKTSALQGKTVAIVGMGGIGLLLAQRLEPFGVKLSATDSKPEKAPKYVKVYKLDEIPQCIAEADYVVLCVRADKDNENLFNAEMIGRMKQGAVLINIARGSLVDEDALAAAIESGQISSAGLDVTKTEPLAENSPLQSLTQVIVTPHIAGMTDLMLEGTVEYLVKIVGEVQAGKAPASVVNRPEKPRLQLTGVPEEAKD